MMPTPSRGASQRGGGGGQRLASKGHFGGLCCLCQAHGGGGFQVRNTVGSSCGVVHTLFWIM